MEHGREQKTQNKWKWRQSMRSGSAEGAWQLRSRDRKYSANWAHQLMLGGVKVLDFDVSFMFFWPRWSDGAAEWLWWPEPRSVSERPSLKSWSGPVWRWWAVPEMLTKSRLVRKLWINVRQQLQKAVSKARVDVKILVYFNVQFNIQTNANADFRLTAVALNCGFRLFLCIMQKKAA